MHKIKQPLFDMDPTPILSYLADSLIISENFKNTNN